MAPLTNKGGARLALSSGVLTWSSGNVAIYRMKADGTGFTTLPAQGSNFGEVVASGGDVHWVDKGLANNTGVFWRWSEAGGAGQLATGLPSPYAVARSAEYVFWAGLYFGADITRTLPDGTGSVAFASGQNRPFSMAVDQDHLYWVTDDGASAVRRRRLDMGQPVETLVAAGGLAPMGGARVAVSSGEVYLAAVGPLPAQPEGRILARKSDGTLSVLAEVPKQRPVGLALDASNVYWLNEKGAVVMRVPRTGGQPQEVARSQVVSGLEETGTDIAVDEISVYWTTLGGIYRAPK